MQVSRAIVRSAESSSQSAKGGTGEESQHTGPGEEGCSGSSEEGAASGPGRTPESGGVCGTERGEHERPRSDGHPHTTADQGGGGRQTTSAAVSGASHHCQHRLQPSLP